MSNENPKNPELFGIIVVQRRSGGDGHVIPLVKPECLLGRADNCDIRIQLPTASRFHCKINVCYDQVRSFLILIKSFLLILNGWALFL